MQLRETLHNRKWGEILSFSNRFCFLFILLNLQVAAGVGKTGNTQSTIRTHPTINSPLYSKKNSSCYTEEDPKKGKLERRILNPLDGSVEKCDSTQSLPKSNSSFRSYFLGKSLQHPLRLGDLDCDSSPHLF